MRNWQATPWGKHGLLQILPEHLQHTSNQWQMSRNTPKTGYSTWVAAARWTEVLVSMSRPFMGINSHLINMWLLMLGFQAIHGPLFSLMVTGKSGLDPRLRIRRPNIKRLSRICWFCQHCSPFAYLSYTWWCKNQGTTILWMEEILHQLVTIGHCETL